MAKYYYKTVPEINAGECTGCCANGNDQLCYDLIERLVEKTDSGCGELKVIFKFIKRED